MKNIQNVTLFALSLFLFSCVDRDYDFPDLSGDCFAVDSETRVRNVNTVFTSATATAVAFESLNNNPTNPEFGVLEGYVVSSDLGGNFFKTLSVVSLDGSRGFNIPIDNRNEALVRRYEPGRRVTVELKGLFYNISNGALNVGELFTNNSIGRISNETYARIVKRNCQKVDEEQLVIKDLTIPQALNDNNLHKLFEFDNIQFTDIFVNKTYFDASNASGSGTDNLITDVFGNTLRVRVSQFANFSNQIIPNGSGKIRGVLTKFGSNYQFIVRTIDDIKLDNPRLVPNVIFQENFNSAADFNQWTAFSVVGTQVWGLSTTLGNPAPCARMNGFSGGSVANEDWLISPEVNLTGFNQVGLTFQTASRFSGPLLEVFVSTDYVSGAPSTANWTALTGFVLDTNTGSFIWTSSGGINLDSFAGNSIRIAFKYTSTTSSSTEWLLDNVRVIAL